jgi:inner membrane protein
VETVRVSPIAITRFFTPRGLAILQSELLWIWLSAIVFASFVLMLRRASRPHLAMPNE